jgi:hypothetical protein
VERWLGYAIAYGTVLPGMFETAELLETLGLLKKSRINPSTLRTKGLNSLRVDPKQCLSTVERVKKNIFPSAGHSVLILLGALCLISSVLIPECCFPLIWIGFTIFLDPFVYRFGGKSLLRDFEDGNPQKIYLLLIAGLICGILWEFWNYWTLSKWVYTVPFFEERKGFEMPFLGFLGFPPFAVQAYVIYNFISLFRSGRGWEESTYCLNSEKKTRPLTMILTAILIGSFYVFIFRAIDFKTVNSYYPRLKDAYWIESHYRMELPKVGITTFDDLLSKTREKTERDELALRLLIPKELLIQWVEKAQLIQLKGLGIENLRLLERVDIHSISDLAKEDPDKLYEKIKNTLHERLLPRKAKIRIWIREARKEVRSAP